MMINTSVRFQDFLKKFPLLLPTIAKLNEARIDWLIGGSACLFLLGNTRMPDDVDIFVPDHQHDKADEVFGITSFFYNSNTEHVRNSNPYGSHALQLTSSLQLNLDMQYHVSVTEAVLQKKIAVQHEDTVLYLLPPEDVLLIKALLQRGPEVGKHDAEDIKNFMKIYTIDRAYLTQRIQELGAAQRVGSIFISAYA